MHNAGQQERLTQWRSAGQGLDRMAALEDLLRPYYYETKSGPSANPVDHEAMQRILDAVIGERTAMLNYPGSAHNTTGASRAS